MAANGASLEKTQKRTGGKDKQNGTSQGLFMHFSEGCMEDWDILPQGISSLSVAYIVNL